MIEIRADITRIVPPKCSIAVRSGRSLITSSRLLPSRAGPMTRSVCGSLAASVAKAAPIEESASGWRRSTVSSTVGGISTAARRRVAGPVRSTIAVAPTVASSSSCTDLGTSLQAAESSRMLAACAVATRSSRKRRRKAAIVGTKPAMPVTITKTTVRIMSLTERLGVRRRRAAVLIADGSSRPAIASSGLVSAMPLVPLQKRSATQHASLRRRRPMRQTTRHCGPSMPDKAVSAVRNVLPTAPTSR